MKSINKITITFCSMGEIRDNISVTVLLTVQLTKEIL